MIAATLRTYSVGGGDVGVLWFRPLIRMYDKTRFRLSFGLCCDAARGRRRPTITGMADLFSPAVLMFDSCIVVIWVFGSADLFRTEQVLSQSLASNGLEDRVS